jgi:hypothetical protein
MTSLKTQQIEIPHFLPECVVQAGVRNDMSLFVKEAWEKVRLRRTFSHAFPIMNTCHSEWSFSGMRNLNVSFPDVLTFKAFDQLQ